MRDVASHYKEYVSYQFKDDDKSIELGEHGHCRFCGETDPNYFRKIAHTLPASLGNKYLFSLDECDKCNEKFGKYESELSLFSNIFLALGGVKGKRGSKKIKTKLLEVSRSDVNISTFRVDQKAIKSIEFDGQTGSTLIQFTNPIQSFIPRYSYKSLCKCALSILPVTELKYYTNLIRWILDTEDQENFHLLECYFCFDNPPQHRSIIAAKIYKRICPLSLLPYMTFVLYTGPVAFRINLMPDHLDNHTLFVCPDEIHPHIGVRIANGDDIFKIEYKNRYILNWASRDRQINTLEANFTIEFTVDQRALQVANRY